MSSEGFDGESYADIPTVEQTVGLVPPRATRAARLQEMREISDFARLLGCDVIGLHLGFVPHDRTVKLYLENGSGDPSAFAIMREQRSSRSPRDGTRDSRRLLAFLADVQRQNLFINFDPANMIHYGTGEPIAALRNWATTSPVFTARMRRGVINLEDLGT